MTVSVFEVTLQFASHDFKYKYCELLGWKQVYSI